MASNTPKRNMMTGSWSPGQTSGDNSNDTTVQDTEYRRAFGGHEKKTPPTEGGSTNNSPTFTNRNSTLSRRPTSTKDLLVATTPGKVLTTDWTTSYMSDFRIPTTTSKIPQNSPPKDSSSEILLRKSKKKEDDNGETMMKLMRHSNYLPNPIPEEKRSFDDDENANPTLKNFIELISRK